MTSAPTRPAASLSLLLRDASLEMTGKDVGELAEARDSIPDGTRINVTFLGNEDLPRRLAAAKAVKDSGFVPVPHVSARRLVSRHMLEEFLAEADEIFSKYHKLVGQERPGWADGQATGFRSA